MGEPAVKFDVNSVLNGAKKTDAKKSSVKDMAVDSATQQLAQEVARYDGDKKNAEAGLKTKKAELYNVINPIRLAMIRQFGYGSSFKIGLEDSKSLIMSWKHQYSKIPLEAEDALRREFAESYDEYYFIERMSIKIKESQYTQEGLTRLMQGGLTADNFAEICEVERWIEPTERYTQDYPTFSEERRKVCDQYISQYAPAYKVK